MDVSEFMKLDPERLKQVQAIIDLFHLLGMTDEDIENLANIARSWPTITKNLNDYTIDLANLKRVVFSGKTDKNGAYKPDTPDGIRNLVGFDSADERIDIDKKGGSGR